MYYIFENILDITTYKTFFDYNENNNNYNINLISNDIKYTEEKLVSKLNNFINIIKTSNDVNYLYVDTNLLDFEKLNTKMYETISQNFEKYTKYDNIFVISHNNSTLNLYKIDINKLIRISSVVYYNFELNFINIVEYNIKKCNTVYINDRINDRINNISNNINTINDIHNFNINQTYDNITKNTNQKYDKKYDINYNINNDKILKERLLNELKQTFIKKNL